jgi:hypothetical protein
MKNMEMRFARADDEPPETIPAYDFWSVKISKMFV